MEPVKHPLFARYFDWCGNRNENRGVRELRQELLAGLSGRVTVLPLLFGDGYHSKIDLPAMLAAARAVDPGLRVTQTPIVGRYSPVPALTDRLTEAAQSAPVPIRVADGTAGALPAADGEFDAVVVSGVLCSVTDVPGALTEFRRALRPGGHLRFFEHVASRDRVLGLVQGVADPFWSRAHGGCHVRRDTREAIGRVFTVETCRGLRIPTATSLSPVAPRIIGVARKD